MKNPFYFDEYIEINNLFNSLKGKYLLSEDNEIYLFNDFKLISKEIETIKKSWVFWKKPIIEIETLFYIQHIQLISSDGAYLLLNDNPMCSTDGIELIVQMKNNFDMLENKFISLATHSNTPIIFSPFDKGFTVNK